MTKTQKQFIHALFELYEEHGYRGSMPIADILNSLNLTKETAYNNNEETGELWDIGQKKHCYVHFSQDMNHASINFSMREVLENWCGFSRY